MHKIVVGQINIKYIRNKFGTLMAAVAGNIDILLITETKIGSKFPVNQFYLNGYNIPYRYDRNTNSASILVYVRDDIRSHIIECENLPSSFENMVKKPTCFQNSAKPTCTDLTLTNKPGMFQNAKTYETGLSYFHKLVVGIIKLSNKRRSLRMIKYRDS